MRIRRPKLQMPHPFYLMALAMLWPLYAVILTTTATPVHETSQGVAALQVVEVQADKLWREVALVPERIRAHLRSDHAS